MEKGGLQDDVHYMKTKEARMDGVMTEQINNINKTFEIVMAEKEELREACEDQRKSMESAMETQMHDAEAQMEQMQNQFKAKIRLETTKITKFLARLKAVEAAKLEAETDFLQRLAESGEETAALREQLLEAGLDPVVPAPALAPIAEQPEDEDEDDAEADLADLD
jgi:exonuclease VII large subunit